MAKTYTGNEDIDKYLRHNINPDFQIDDIRYYIGCYWKDYFLDYLRRVGSKEDIEYVMEEYFGEERLKQETNNNVIIAIVRLGYCLDYFSKINNVRIRTAIAKQGHNINLFTHDQHQDVRIDQHTVLTRKEIHGQNLYGQRRHRPLFTSQHQPELSNCRRHCIS